MGTRSTIAIRNADGTVTGTYCHWDGYLSHNGRILQENYTDEAAVRELIALGDLSSLGERIGSKHDFNNAPRDECNAYGRDRNETGCESKLFGSWEALLNEQGQEYNYIYEPADGCWHVEYYGRFGKLADEMAQEEAAQEE